MADATLPNIHNSSHLIKLYTTYNVTSTFSLSPMLKYAKWPILDTPKNRDFAHLSMPIPTKQAPGAACLSAKAPAATVLHRRSRWGNFPRAVWRIYDIT
jgi:hypothetical protein